MELINLLEFTTLALFLGAFTLYHPQAPRSWHPDSSCCQFSFWQCLSQSPAWPGSEATGLVPPSGGLHYWVQCLGTCWVPENLEPYPWTSPPQNSTHKSPNSQVSRQNSSASQNLTCPDGTWRPCLSLAAGAFLVTIAAEPTSSKCGGFKYPWLVHGQAPQGPLISLSCHLQGHLALGLLVHKGFRVDGFFTWPLASSESILRDRIWKLLVS